MDILPNPPENQISDATALRGLIAQSPRMFSLNLAVCDEATLRNAAVRQLRAEFPAVEAVALWPYDKEVFEHVHTASSREPKDALFIFGLDDALAADIDRPALLAGLNASPPRWKAWFACPVIFWVDCHTADILRLRAPDFWEWQQDVYRLDA
jgi:hypothetical protein